MIKLSDAFKKEQDRKEIIQAIYALLYDDSSVYQRLETAAKKLTQYELDKWPVITYLLFMVYPTEYMFVKPTMTKQAAANRGFDIQYESKVNANTYKRIISLSQDLFQRLNDDKREELHPLDMIDVQGFMWCTYGSGWNAEELRQAKEQLDTKS